MNEYPHPSNVVAGVRYGPGLSMVGTADDSFRVAEASTLVDFRTELADGRGVEAVTLELLGTQRIMLTGTAGEISANVTPGTYQLRTTPRPGYEPVPDRPIVVADQDLSVVIELELTDPLPPPDAEMIDVVCVVFVNGLSVEGATITADLSASNSIGLVIASTAPVRVVTDSTGRADLRLYRGSSFTSGDGIYSIEARDRGKVIWSYRAALPDVDSIYLPEMITWDESRIRDAERDAGRQLTPA